MAFTNPTVVNQADYTTFLRNELQITTTVLPDTSEWITSSLAVAQEIVNDTLNAVSPRIFVLATYNLAADRLLNYAIDVSGQTFFSNFRKEEGLLEISVGAITSGSDQGTSASVMNPEQMKDFTLQDLQTLKTPYGRQYMAFAQMYGSSAWTLS